ncbi:Lysophospholipase L1 [Cyclobacterium lianum]|uniref:Lysophospholipase L1 n=1 Tax=Cyclobacterium lianum TaxID=388280 RepID=A0A1M7QCK1_9BACT|nr:GDSL-type esterase/lipase family protein [Cyclobacterium lianum]SHN28400.1 Lysophospholipase L1 [Cyclobacterium lianum]
MADQHSDNPAVNRSKDYRYLALGDSYTVGEGVPQEDSFPYQTGHLLEKAGVPITNIDIIARTGWTSGELLQEIRQRNLSPGAFELLSLLIGVNNQYRGLSLEQFETELKQLIETSLDLTNRGRAGMVLISIPDWGVTPFADSGTREKASISREIDAYNQIVKKLAADFQIPYLDITDRYRAIGGKPVNLAPDKLHPSGQIYAAWADLLSKVFQKAVKT